MLVESSIIFVKPGNEPGFDLKSEIPAIIMKRPKASAIVAKNLIVMNMATIPKP